KSRMREASIVDIGSNDDALAVALYNDNGDLCNLSGQSIAHSAMPLKDWDELDRSGELERLKTDNFPLFKRKFQERFGKEWKEPAIASSRTIGTSLSYVSIDLTTLS